MDDMELVAKVRKYGELTGEALRKVSIKKGVSKKELKIAQDFLLMAKSYCSDAGHFERNGEMLLALAAYSYAHAWLDAGVKAGILDGKGDDRLFTLP
ncbi:MAG: DUF357 domain-containing protein [Candidatus Diapherotrites archaeon]|nr:DUF357 domain-containing protein [Candidatus Diapherotrites archaeon]